MLSASHQLLAQARFCGRTHLPLSPDSTTPTVQVIFRYLRPDAPVFNRIKVGMVTFRQSPCWYYAWMHVVVSTSSDTQHLWTWWHFGDHTSLINLSTTSAVFTPAGYSSTITWPWVFRVKSCLWLHCVFLGPNPAPGCVTDFQGRILVTVPNSFSDSSFINHACAHAVFEKFTDNEWHNPFGTSSDGWSDPLEQNCLGVGNSKTRRTLRQQIIIIYYSMFRPHTIAWKRKKNL